MSLQQQRALAAGFHGRKKAILVALNSDTPDKSPKGYVDEPLLPLIVLINNHPDYVTTSSCSGRICTYLEGMEEGDEDDHKKQSDDDGKDDTEEQDVKGYAENTSLAAVEAAKRAKGGQWLYVSHDPVEWPSFPADQKSSERKWIIETLFGPEAHRVVLMKGDPESDENEKTQIQGDDQDDIAKAQLVYFKFEPMILHIESSTPAAAKIFLNHSLFSGYRNSGILPSAKRTMLAIRSTLKLDAPIAYIIPGNSTSSSASDSAAKIQLMVTLSYLRVLLHLSNDKFVSNVAQMARFEIRLKEHLLKDGQGGDTHAEAKTGDQGAWEDKDARRERKRREGLEKKAAAAAAAATAKTEAEAMGTETKTVDKSCTP
ncbi:tRNA wybutosine-synthesizing protein 3 [Entomortierella parvispora]|uniref:tRNA(Phe) 7-[(3-amino-3-carboxypropyl)-4-demethylwyosine(37)-N(4)]-methyltransferase n=1 Tax=Entomortierella parvispora TaxID=205924 RepID=A0A9P3HDU6_9FUNG|nr:tRNA wybutosine-synthesizing protein 3 [Entomortierella parvispora]